MGLDLKSFDWRSPRGQVITGIVIICMTIVSIPMLPVIGGLLLLGALVAIYMAPTIVAALRKHPNVAPIAVINVLLGWTLIGFAIALAWAFMAKDQS